MQVINFYKYIYTSNFSITNNEALENKRLSGVLVEGFIYLIDISHIPSCCKILKYVRQW